MAVTPISLDNGISGLFYYCLTLTSPDDFTPEQESGISAWHRSYSDYCLLVREYHGDGRKHYHSLIGVKKPKTAGGVTRVLERLWGKLELRWTKGVSVHVKKMTCMSGQFHYLLKEQKGDPPLLLTGWKYTWIKAQCKANIKNIPLKMLKGDTYMVQKNTSVELVLKFASASGVRLSCKDSFMDLIVEMQASGYQFDNVRMKFLYGNVMARSGNMRQARSVLEQELFGLD